ncbi:unnamed protein product [Prorocentrum cordatum]|uniref:Uncharacterized protein n=1 Tax=Prorocentrum cordatum TaxID=2364126 RepID=A0ABN9T6U8_9DINO|nr:unnamed protein product [Polarella glacialis]
MMQNVAQQVAHERYLRQTYKDRAPGDRAGGAVPGQGRLRAEVGDGGHQGSRRGGAERRPAPWRRNRARRIRVSYAEPVQSSRPTFTRGKGGGKGRAEQPHIFPKDGVGPGRRGKTGEALFS